MKQLNRVAKQIPEPMVYNPEHGLGYKMSDDLTLFLMAINFKLKNSFYATDKQKMDKLESLIDSVKDFEYKMALAKYAANTLGIRLSPVIILTREALKMKINDEPNQVHRDLIRKAGSYVFDRPDKFANAMAYTTYMTKQSIKYLPAFYKRMLKDAFEKLNVNALNKYKMRRREVKLADLIKVLRPKPNNDKKNLVFKQIINNDLRLEKDIKVILANDNLSKVQKDEWINKNVKDLPINAFLTNLRNVPDTMENAKVLADKLNFVLQIEAGLPGMKIINPFNVLVAGIECNKPIFSKVIANILDTYVSKLNLGLGGKKVSILVDVSGSMSGERIETVSRYFSFIFPALANSDIKLYAFNTRITDMNHLVKGLKVSNPLTIRETIKINFKPNGGTSLADSVRSIYNQDKPDLIVVFSDEVSWADRGENYVEKLDVPGNIIAVNPDVIDNYSAFSQRKPNLIKVSGLDAKILYYMPLLGNFNVFKDWLKSQL